MLLGVLLGKGGDGLCLDVVAVNQISSRALIVEQLQQLLTAPRRPRLNAQGGLVRESSLAFRARCRVFRSVVRKPSSRG